MNGKNFVLLILAVVVSFIGGFFVANGLNKSELETLRKENSQLKNTADAARNSESEPTISDAELNEKIAEADRNKDDLQVQKKFGSALYAYGAMKKDARILSEAARILTRFVEKNPEDRESSLTLGHAYFDYGYYRNDNESLVKARNIYQKLLSKTPKDVEIRTDLALTFYLQNPPDYERAIDEMKISLQENPKHEKTLQFMVNALIKMQRTQDAETYLVKLREVNPNTPSLAEIQKQLEQSENINK